MVCVEERARLTSTRVSPLPQTCNASCAAEDCAFDRITGTGPVLGLQVREKFSAGKLKDLTLPRLKQFISSHKLGKVGGKKEELLAIVEAFLRAGKKES